MIITQEQYNRAVEIERNIADYKYLLGSAQAKLVDTNKAIEKLVKEKNRLETVCKEIDSEIEKLKKEIEEL